HPSPKPRKSMPAPLPPVTLPTPSGATPACSTHAAHSHGQSHTPAHQHGAAAGTGAGPRIDIACCPSDGASGATAPSTAKGAPAHSDHDGHDHSTLPGWGRIGASLLVATAAELLHLLGPDTPLWHGAGMALAAVAI